MPRITARIAAGRSAGGFGHVGERRRHGIQQRQGHEHARGAQKRAAGERGPSGEVRGGAVSGAEGSVVKDPNTRSCGTRWEAVRQASVWMRRRS